MLMSWAGLLKIFGLSYYKTQIIRVQLSDNPYPRDFANPIFYTTFAYNRIQIIYILMDITNTSPYP
jgi:hypothetical protein